MNGLLLLHALALALTVGLIIAVLRRWKRSIR